jgi:hypothetical protein
MDYRGNGYADYNRQTLVGGDFYSVLPKLGREVRPDQNRVVKCETSSLERDVVQGRERGLELVSKEIN